MMTENYKQTKTVNKNCHLFAAFLTEVGVISLQELSLHKLIQGVLQSGVLHRKVEGRECFLTLVPAI